MSKLDTPIKIYAKLTNTSVEEVSNQLSKSNEIYGKMNPRDGYCKIKKEGKINYLTISPRSNSEVNLKIKSDYKNKDLESIIDILRKIKN